MCRHLERLYQQTVSNETTGEAKIASLADKARELLEVSMPVLMFALSAPKVGAGLPPSFSELLSWSRSNKQEEPECKDSNCHQLIAALLQQAHFQLLVEDDVEGSPVSRPDVGISFPSLLVELQTAWQTEVQDTGLLGVFTANSDLALEARRSFLELCVHLDKFCFFVVALRPYRQLASAGGDAALCWLRRGLSHLLQELDKSMLQVRQARLALMQVAKKHLQDLAKRMEQVTEMDVRWMQDLSHVDELRLDELHQACASSNTEVSALTSAVREVELKAKAKEGLQQIAAAFMNPDFQARCSLALPERLATEMRELANSSRVPAVEFRPH